MKKLTYEQFIKEKKKIKSQTVEISIMYNEHDHSENIKVENIEDKHKNK